MHAKRFHLCGVTSYFFTLLMTNVVQRFLHCIKSVPRFLAVTPPTNNKKINLTLRFGRAPVLVLLRFRFFLKPPMRSFRILVMENLPFWRNYNMF